MGEETAPLVHGFPLGTLVGDEPDDLATALATQGEEVAQGLLHGDATAAKTGAHAEEEVVHVAVAQGMVDLGSVEVGLQVEGEGGHPLPVAEVTEVDEGVVVVVCAHALLQTVEAYPLDATAHLALGEGLHLHGLHQIVAEEVVEPSLGGESLGLALAGEALGQLAADKGAAVAQQMVDEGVEQQVAQGVVEAEREQGEGVPAEA